MNLWTRQLTQKFEGFLLLPLKQERMWNSFQGDRESGLFSLLSESIDKDQKREYVESVLRDYREFFERL